MHTRLRKTAALLALLLAVLLASCSAAVPLEGIYTLTGEAPEYDAPYLILSENRFTWVAHPAVSYQPSGVPVRENGRLILQGRYGNEDFRFVFRIRDEETLLYAENESHIAQPMPGFPEKGSRWKYWRNP